MAVFKATDLVRGKPRTRPWCVKVPGFPKKFFLTKAEADEHSARLITAPTGAAELARSGKTVGDLVTRYKDDVTPTKRGCGAETSRLDQILHKEPGKTLCAVKLSQLQPHHAWTYITARQKQKSQRGDGLVTPRTISRERNLLQDVLQIAIERWGYTTMVNAFRGLKIKGSKFRRQRRLEDGSEFMGEQGPSEYEKLIDASRDCRGVANRLYLPLAIDIVLETGMRGDKNEVFELQWGDIDFERRTIAIRTSKTDEHQESPGRTIVLPWMTMVRLAGLLDGKKKVRRTDRIFPMTKGALQQAFDRAKVRAGCPDLQWKDLRREANTRFGEREPALTDTQRKAMLGHLDGSNDTNDIYSAPALRVIRQKLDMQFCGVTFEQRYAKKIKDGWTNFRIAAVLAKGELPMPWEMGDDGDWAEEPLEASQ